MVVEDSLTRYARTAEGEYVAYQVVGNDPIDVVLSMNGGLAIDLIWDEPLVSTCMLRLASFSRLIVFDQWAFGSSSRVQPSAVPAVQTWMDSFHAVMDAAGSDRAAILAWGESTVAAMMFAATYPERVTSLVLVNPFARYARSDETPWGMPRRLIRTYAAAIQDAWGTGEITATIAPSIVHSEEAKRRWARLERLSATPDVLAAMVRAVLESDVTEVLSAIRAPTLVVSRRGDRHVRHEHGSYVAGRIPDARFVEHAGDDHLLFAGGVDEILDEAQEFVTGFRPVSVLDRVLATVLFTDIVGSTEHATQLGDRAWRELLNRYDDLVAPLLERFRGKLVKGTGDGTLATFDGPARAVECAKAIAGAVGRLGLDIRAGLHTGEVEGRKHDVAGAAVHIAARVMAIAKPQEVLVSSTVKDLVVGSGIEFSERGEHELKGVPGVWKLFAVESWGERSQRATPGRLLGSDSRRRASAP